MFFTSSSVRSRNKFIDDSIEVTDTALAHKAMSLRIGENTVKAMRHQLDNMYVPNVRAGQLKIKRDLANDSIPIIALAPGEQIARDPRILIQTPTQTRRTESYLRKRGADEDDITNIVHQITHPPANVTSQATPIEITSQEASVIARPLLVDTTLKSKDSRRIFLGRPLVAAAYHGQPRINPAILIHELAHVEQFIAEPVAKLETPKDATLNSYRRELEAYHIQCFAERGLVDMDYSPLEGERFGYYTEEGSLYGTAQYIEDVRAITNEQRKDHFFPNGTLIKMLEDEGLDIA